MDKNFLNENNPKETDKDEMTKDKIHTEKLRRKSLVPSLHSLQIANRANKTLEILAKQSYVILLMIMMVNKLFSTVAYYSVQCTASYAVSYRTVLFHIFCMMFAAIFRLGALHIIAGLHLYC